MIMTHYTNNEIVDLIPVWVVIAEKMLFYGIKNSFYF